MATTINVNIVVNSSIIITLLKRNLKALNILFNVNSVISKFIYKSITIISNVIFKVYKDIINTFSSGNFIYIIKPKKLKVNIVKDMVTSVSSRKTLLNIVRGFTIRLWKAEKQLILERPKYSILTLGACHRSYKNLPKVKVNTNLHVDMVIIPAASDYVKSVYIAIDVATLTTRGNMPLVHIWQSPNQYPGGQSVYRYLLGSDPSGFAYTYEDSVTALNEATGGVPYAYDGSATIGDATFTMGDLPALQTFDKYLDVRTPITSTYGDFYSVSDGSITPYTHGTVWSYVDLFPQSTVNDANSLTNTTTYPTYPYTAGLYYYYDSLNGGGTFNTRGEMDTFRDVTIADCLSNGYGLTTLFYDTDGGYYPDVTIPL